MVRQHHHLLLTLMVVFDALAIAWAWLLCYWLRFANLPIDPAKGR